MKTLVIVAHPEIEKSIINKRWTEELLKHPDLFSVHELYKKYPDWNIDVEAEHKLVESHENLILQFPVYWFGCPPMLKKWIDDVFTHNWAYGAGSAGLSGRKTALAVSAGIDENKYGRGTEYNYSLGELLAPFETTFRYCNADYKSFYAFYGAESDLSEERIEKSTAEYLQFLNSL